MLSVTDRAATALAEKLARKGLTSAHGYRISLVTEGENGPRFRLQAAAAPALRDEVVQCGETAVFVAMDAVEPLANAVLDADGTDGEASLLLRRAR